MAIHEILAVLITFTAAASYVNYRFIRLPQVIGVTLITVIISLAVIILGHFGFTLGSHVQTAVNTINFSSTVLNGMLSFLLFAGALHINVLELAEYRVAIFLLATISVVLSTFIVGGLVYLVSHGVGLPISFMSCLIFGALISPTDPIAVLSVLKTIAAPKNIEMKIAGESLFNDGTSIVLFVTLISMASGQKIEGGTIEVAMDLCWKIGGGFLVGGFLGLFVAKLMQRVSNFEVSCLLTLALVTGGFVFADSIFHVSGPIAMVVAGLVIGTKMRSGHIPETSVNRLDSFWELVDELLNTVLFTLIGLELLEFIFNLDSIFLGLLTIPLVLIARFVSVAVPVMLMSQYRKFTYRLVAIMTWGGLRGSVSVALALQIPEDLERNLIVTLTYLVVLFSLLVQGLTIRPLMARLLCNNKTG